MLLKTIRTKLSIQSKFKKAFKNFTNKEISKMTDNEYLSVIGVGKYMFENYRTKKQIDSIRQETSFK